MTEVAKTYQVVLVTGFVPPDLDLAWHGLNDVLRADDPCDPLIAAFREKLARRYPDCVIYADDDENSEEEAEDCEAAFNFTVGNRHVRASIVSADEAADARDLIAMGLREGLAAFDFRTDQIHRPGGFSGVTLKVEDRPFLVGPRLTDVLDAIASLTPAGGPSFMIVERGAHDYAQIAGGDGHFAFEWREPADRGFRHWVAGYPGEEVKGLISVMTNGYHVPVRSNENLSGSDAARLFESYLDGDGRPSDFLWRDMTDEFA